MRRYCSFLLFLLSLAAFPLICGCDCGGPGVGDTGSRYGEDSDDDTVDAGDDGADNDADDDIDLDDDQADDDGDDDQDDDDADDDDTIDDDTIPPEDWDEEFAPEATDENGVFASPDGDDWNTGTRESPVRTLARAIEIASPRAAVVFAAEGEYYDQVESDVSLYGGYDIETWTRDIDLNITVIRSTLPVTLSPETDTTSLDVEGFTIQGEDTAMEIRPGGAEIRIGRNFITTRSRIDWEINSVAIVGWSNRLYRLHRNAVFPGNFNTPSGAVSIGVELTGPVEMTGNFIVGGIVTTETGDEISKGVIVHWDGPERSVFVNNIIVSQAGFRSVGLQLEGEAVIVDNTFTALGASHAYALDLATGPLTLVNNIAVAQGITASIRAADLAEDNLLLVNNDIRNNGIGPLLEANGEDISGIGEINNCLWTGCGESRGNFDDDPMLTPNRHLMLGSPCIDAGIDPSPYLTGYFTHFDYDGRNRPSGDGWEVGADEF